MIYNKSMKKVILLPLLLISIVSRCNSLPPIEEETETSDTYDLNDRYSTIFSKVSERFNSLSITRGSRKKESSEYETIYSFASNIAKSFSNLYKHKEYDAHTRITKWTGKYDRSGKRIIGYQTYSKINLETGEINIRYSQGEDADWYYAIVALDINFDFTNEDIGDFYFATSSLERDFSIVEGRTASEYIRTGDIITTRNDNSLFYERINEYVSLAPSAYLEENPTIANSYSEAIISAFGL